MSPRDLLTVGWLSLSTAVFANSDLNTQIRNPTNEVLPFEYICQKQSHFVNLKTGETKELPLSECTYWEGYFEIKTKDGNFFVGVGNKMILYKLSAGTRYKIETDMAVAPNCWESKKGNYPRNKDGSCNS